MLRGAIFLLSASGAVLGSAEAREFLVSDEAGFASAVKAVRPGDSIVLRNGEWRDFQILFVGNGTARQPIRLVAQTPGQVLLTGQSNLRIGGRHLHVSGLVFRGGFSPSREVISFRRDSKVLASDSRVTEVVIDGFSKPDRRAEDIWVALYGSGNRVDHSHFEGKTNAGVTLAVIRKAGGPLDNRHRIDHNYFGPRPPLGSNGGETIRIGTSEESLSSSHTTVERNIFDRTSGEVEIVSVKSGGNVVRENLVLSSQGAFVLRHGNGNRIERNIFLGNHIPDSGGVRIINGDQVVRDNYFEGLAGQDFKSAISVMNGVPNSAINRYHQVSNAVLERNSVIDSARITLAAGADAERSAAPVSSRFAFNLIVGAKGADPFRADGDVSGIEMVGNVEAQTQRPLFTLGVTQREVQLERASNGLLYPVDPALAGVGAPRDLVPVTREEVGVPWYRTAAPVAAVGTGRIIALGSSSSLADAFAATAAGDTLLLAAGVYEVAAPLVLRHQLTIAGPKGRDATLRVASGLARIEGGGGLRLENIAVEARKIAAEGALIAVGSGVAPNYNIVLEDVSVRGPARGRFDGIVMAPGTFANAISITRSRFADMGVVVVGTGEDRPKGWYPVERLTIADSHFDRVAMVADLLRKGSDESTFGPHFEMTQSDVADSGVDGVSLRLSGAQHALLSGNRFARSGGVAIIHSVGTPDTRLVGNRFVATPAPRIEELVYSGPLRAHLSGNILEARP
ncbi:MAG: polysaccharide lyase 6 family protein [Sphingopyxis sp.]|uniref:polysaccharide lyase 6 family protein n=1 Tax=Sphingopyxis sp. TaxID=1908224 RepID=UPI002AB8F5E0|nr:polysaccharide lyase 6 family protein [Sphingopyxis sp.]MDZ3832720.1 polysaccharide lyase 6 family protein [Sphingopyxis sp.]